MSLKLEMIFGVRFRAGAEVDTTEGPLKSDTVVVMAEPVSGPIHLHADLMKGQFWARCRCGETSNRYRNRANRTIITWARFHQCDEPIRGTLPKGF